MGELELSAPGDVVTTGPWGDGAMASTESRQQAADLYRDDRIGRRDALRGGLSGHECDEVERERRRAPTGG